MAEPDAAAVTATYDRAMTIEEYFADERAGAGRVQVWRHRTPDALWFVTFLPDAKPGAQPTGKTYTPTDVDLPHDYPGNNDPAELLAWARKRAASQ